MAVAQSALAQEAPATQLSLRGAIETALANNLGLEIQRIDPKIGEEAVIGEEAAFDPSLFSRANLEESDLEWTDLNGDVRKTTSDTRSYSAGVSKRVKSGAQVTASASHTRSDGSSFNPELNQLVGGGLSERASLSLALTQPLLRDFGSEVNLAPVRKAKSQARVADLQTRNAVFDLLQQTELAYWRLADADARRVLRDTNLKLAEQFLAETKERERLGLATQLEILQAEASLAQRRDEIIRADQAIREAADTLFAVMGSLDDALAIDASVTVDSLEVSMYPIPGFDEVRQAAFDRNFDTDIQEEILAQLAQDRILSKNSRRPTVDLTVSTSFNGLSPRSGSDSFNEALDRRGDDWGIGFAFELPWGSRSANSNFRQTEYRIEQAEMRLMEIKQDLLRSVRSAWRNLTSSREQLKAAELVVELQEATFQRERSMLEEGLSTLRNVLETQRDRDNAALSLLDAQLAAREAEIQLSRVEGTLLQRNGLDWNSEAVALP